MSNFQPSGFQRDPYDAQDRSFKELLPKLSVGSGDIDLVELVEATMTTVSQQAWSSSCVANGTADMFELATALDGEKVEDISRLQIYWNGRCIMYAELIDSGKMKEFEIKDEGMFIRAAMKAISKCGVCPESMWPFDLNNINRRPSLKATFRALKNRIDSYYRFDSSGDELLDDFHKALLAKQPVVFAIPVTSSFQENDGPELIQPPGKSEEIIGYHCIGAVGKYGDNIKIRNSWGTDWRNGGYAYLTPAWFTSGLAEDGWTFTRGKALRT
jgi:hypothetical protein